MAETSSGCGAPPVEVATFTPSCALPRSMLPLTWTFEPPKRRSPSWVLLVATRPVSVTREGWRRSGDLDPVDAVVVRDDAAGGRAGGCARHRDLAAPLPSRRMPVLPVLVELDRRASPGDVDLRVVEHVQPAKLGRAQSVVVDIGARRDGERPTFGANARRGKARHLDASNRARRACRDDDAVHARGPPLMRRFEKQRARGRQVERDAARIGRDIPHGHRPAGALDGHVRRYGDRKRLSVGRHADHTGGQDVHDRGPSEVTERVPDRLEGTCPGGRSSAGRSASPVRAVDAVDGIDDHHGSIAGVARGARVVGARRCTAEQFAEVWQLPVTQSPSTQTWPPP